VLTDAIPLKGIKGRFDHFGYGRGCVFAAALSRNAVVVVSVGATTLEHTISGVPDPQGVVYVPETNKVFVASGSAGKVYFYDGASHSRITTVHARQPARRDEDLHGSGLRKTLGILRFALTGQRRQCYILCRAYSNNPPQATRVAADLISLLDLLPGGTK
jgi:hypothetical protein